MMTMSVDNRYRITVLLRLADGDPDLVQEALRETSAGKDAAPFVDAVVYILDVKERVSDPNAVAVGG